MQAKLQLQIQLQGHVQVQLRHCLWCLGTSIHGIGKCSAMQIAPWQGAMLQYLNKCMCCALCRSLACKQLHLQVNLQGHVQVQLLD